jgi:asparagine synthase (glutamine-hydrolysing)
MYEKFGMEKALQYMDGVFAFMLIDYSDEQNMKAFVARDPFGVRSLFTAILYGKNFKSLVFASEMKYFADIIKNQNIEMLVDNVEQFKPGTYFEYSHCNETLQWDCVNEKTYFNVNAIMDIPIDIPDEHLECVDGYSYWGVEEVDTQFSNLYDKQVEKYTLQSIKSTLEDAVLKRVTTTDRPVACLLSGGLDSSLITSLVNKYYSKQGKKLETYSIGMEGGEDLKYAQIVADFLGTKHTNIIVSEEDFLNAIPEVVRITETYDTTTIRASVGNYLVSKYISEHSDAKVIFNGDGSDEVTGGYMYFHCAPSATEFDLECKRLLDEIHYFDVLRSDRSISNAGLEARTPFLDRRFVQNYLSIPKDLRYSTHKKHCEKYLLRKAFDDGTYLPKEVLWRTKEAFSDGVSSHSRSWYEIIQEHVGNENVIENIDNETIENMKQFLRKHNVTNPDSDITFEQMYYLDLFNKQYVYSNEVQMISHYWMPRFVEASDASARTLQIYSNKQGQSG